MPILDPEFMSAVVVKGAALFERGTRVFPEWSNEMRKIYGLIVEMRLPAIYESATKYHENTKVTSPSKERSEHSADNGQTGHANVPQLAKDDKPGAFIGLNSEKTPPGRIPLGGGVKRTLLNRKQRWLTVAALCLVFASLVLAPWSVKTYNVRGRVELQEGNFAPVWLSPSTTQGIARLRIECLLAEWGGLGILYAGFLALLKDRPPADAKRREPLEDR